MAAFLRIFPSRRFWSCPLCRFFAPFRIFCRPNGLFRLFFCFQPCRLFSFLALGALISARIRVCFFGGSRLSALYFVGYVFFGFGLGFVSAFRFCGFVSAVRFGFSTATVSVIVGSCLHFFGSALFCLLRCGFGGFCLLQFLDASKPLMLLSSRRSLISTSGAPTFSGSLISLSAAVQRLSSPANLRFVGGTRRLRHLPLCSSLPRIAYSLFGRAERGRLPACSEAATRQLCRYRGRRVVRQMSGPLCRLMQYATGT